MRRLRSAAAVVVDVDAAKPRCARREGFSLHANVTLSPCPLPPASSSNTWVEHPLPEGQCTCRACVGPAKTNFSATIGSAVDEPVEPGFVTVGLTKNPNQMQVHTYDASGRPARRPFHIACFRDQ